MLGRHVRGVIRCGNLAQGGRDVDERAATLGPELTQRNRTAVDRPQQVGVDDLGVVTQRNLLEAPQRRDAGVVDPHVNPAELCHRGTSQLLDLLGVGDIGRNCQCGATGGAAGIGDRLQDLRAAGGKDDRRARLREGDGGGVPDAAGGASNDNDARR